MREIKFRAWFKRYHLMDSWEDVKDSLDFYNILTNNKYVVMQYIGLKDKNDVEIYEGDLVTNYMFPNAIGEVAYSVKQQGTWHPHNKTTTYEHIGYEAIEPEELWDLLGPDCEVIGNIYENKELLKWT
jgi:uncharacterized phage protein (TIGR01671 family)